MARFTRRRSRRRITRRKTRRGPRRRFARKTRTRRSLNRHTFVRSAEAVIFNDVANGVDCVSSNPTVVTNPGTLSGGVTPYNSAGNFVTWMQFALDKTPGHNEFQVLYDQFKILGVKVHFEYAATVSTADFSSVPQPKVVFFRDYDDNTLPTFSDLMQRESHTSRRMLRGHTTIYVKPKLKDYIESNPGASSAAATYKTAWIDCNNAAIQHYRLKFALLDWPTYNAPAGVAARPILRIRTEYILQFRNVR